MEGLQKCNLILSTYLEVLLMKTHGKHAPEPGQHKRATLSFLQKNPAIWPASASCLSCVILVL